MQLKPQYREVEKGPFGHISFINKPCTVCRRKVKESDSRVLWIMRAGSCFYGDQDDDESYVCHVFCEDEMAKAVREKRKENERKR